MLNLNRERQAIAALRPLLNLAPGALPAVVALGIATALFEGLGISLFIPLLHSLGQDGAPASTALGQLWGAAWGAVPAATVRRLAPLAILVLLACKNGLLYLNTAMVSRFNWRISQQIRSRIFQQLLAVDSQFLLEHDAGALMGILDQEAWQTTQAISTLAVLVVSLCTLAVFSVFLLLTSWPLTLLSLALVALVSAGVQALTRQVKDLGQRAARANQRFVSQGFEQIARVEMIRQFGQQEAEQASFDRLAGQVAATFMALDRQMGAIAPLSELAFATLLTGVLLLVLWREPTSLSVVLVFLLMLYRLAPQVKTLDAARANLVALAASVESVTALLAATDRDRLPNGHRPFHGLHRGIRFERVSFGYRHGGPAVLHDLTFAIAPGQTVAIVGPSGAGKSTLIGLLLRRFDPTAGVVEVDGQPLPTYDLATWHQQIGVVSQRIDLLNATVRDNIAYGRAGATAAAVERAARLADAHAFITQLPQGYDTAIGEQGVRLSGGQRQRLALARCLVRDPAILILDEATNALDSLSERFIQETLAAVGRDRTVILIAHRLSTVQRADQVLVLEAGRLVEQGSVPELLRQQGLFARMYEAQISPSPPLP